MSNPTKILTLFFCLIGFYSCSQSNNIELQRMYEEDQNARTKNDVDWIVLSKQDKERELKVYQFIKENKIITGKDFYNSAMIFQHGKDSTAYGMAVKHMRKAIELDTTINKWLLAAAIDRELISKNLPQIYGTQFVKYNGDAKWSRYKIDPLKITDEERKLHGVETLAEQIEKEKRMNQENEINKVVETKK